MVLTCVPLTFRALLIDDLLCRDHGVEVVTSAEMRMQKGQQVRQVRWASFMSLCNIHLRVPALPRCLSVIYVSASAINVRKRGGALVNTSPDQ